MTIGPNPSICPEPLWKRAARALERQNAAQPRRVDASEGVQDDLPLVGETAQMALRFTVWSLRVMNADLAGMITGESGTGKFH